MANLESFQSSFMSLHLGNMSHSVCTDSDVHMLSQLSTEYSFEPEKFCTPDNVDRSIAILNQSLDGFGLPTLYSNDIVGLVNCLHQLLQQHQKCARIREELENRLHRAKSDCEHQCKLNTRLRRSLEKFQREQTEMKESERQLKNTHKATLVTVKCHREEAKKLKAVLDYKESQYCHSLRKKDREICRLQERLAERWKERRQNIDIKNLIPRGDGKRLTWNNSASVQKNELEVYKDVISSFDMKHKEVLLENTEMRKLLCSVHREQQRVMASLRQLTAQGMNDVKTALSSVDENNIPLNDTQLAEGHFQLPYSLIQEKLETCLQELWDQVKQCLQGSGPTNQGPSDASPRPVRPVSASRSARKLPPTPGCNYTRGLSAPDSSPEFHISSDQVVVPEDLSSDSETCSNQDLPP